MIRIHRIAAATLVAASALSAQAADFYVGGSVGSSKYKTDGDTVQDGSLTLRLTDKSDTGLKIFGGAEITSNVAVEAGYVDLGKLKFSGNAAGNPFTGDIRGTGFFIDAVGQLPVANDFTLFGKLGVFSGKAKVSVNVSGVGSGSDSDSGTDVTFGLGASYALTKNLSVRGEWERFRFKVYGDKSDADLLSVGLSYKF
jgi:OOP family OmpA-OmpF porin